jgi:hypothetical protein
VRSGAIERLARKGRGGGAMSLEVGSERPGGKGWVGLRRRGFAGFQMAGQFRPGLKSTWDVALAQEK